MKKVILPLLILLLAAVGYGVAMWMEGAKKETAQITKSVDVSSMTTKKIMKMLTSGDFKQRLQARKEISRLKPEDRLQVYRAMAKAKDAAVRLMAVSGLASMKSPGAKKLLQELAKDTDKDVAEQAKEALKEAK